VHYNAKNEKMWSAIYKLQGDLDVFITLPHTKNLSPSSYVLFDTMEVFLGKVSDNIKIREIFQVAKIIGPPLLIIYYASLKHYQSMFFP
jgi:hypothetical protein